MTHKLDNYGTDSSDAHQHFIKPLPCDRNLTHSIAEAKVKHERSNLQDCDIPPIILDPPPQGKRVDDMAKKTSPRQSSIVQGAHDNKNNAPKSLATILRTSGPPPSRTTSARLPSRNDLMSEMQRTAWARHTTKWLEIIWYNNVLIIFVPELSRCAHVVSSLVINYEEIIYARFEDLWFKWI